MNAPSRHDLAYPLDRPRRRARRWRALRLIMAASLSMGTLVPETSLAGTRSARKARPQGYQVSKSSKAPHRAGAPYVPRKDPINGLLAARAEGYDLERSHLVPTVAPPDRTRHIAEWERAGAVVLALDRQSLGALVRLGDVGADNEPDAVQGVPTNEPTPFSGVVAYDPALARALLATARKLAEHVTVVLLVPAEGDHERPLMDTVELLQRVPEGAALLRSPNVRFMMVPYDTKWIRDFGPEFAQTPQGDLIILDSRYEMRQPDTLVYARWLKRVLSTRLPASGNAGTRQIVGGPDPARVARRDGSREEGEEESARYADDRLPSVMALRIRQRRGNGPSAHPVPVYRPPVLLDGGDFLSDGQGLGFTSTATLKLNGGDAAGLNEVFREYYGVKSVAYLNPLPGMAIAHIDMFFQVAGPATYLLATFRGNGSPAPWSRLQSEGQRVLDENERILKSFLSQNHRRPVRVVSAASELRPGTLQIVRVPIPDLLQPWQEDIRRFEERLGQLRTSYESSLQTAMGLEGQLESLRERMAAWVAYEQMVAGYSQDPRLIDASSLAKILAEVDEPAEDHVRPSVDEQIQIRLRLARELAPLLEMHSGGMRLRKQGSRFVAERLEALRVVCTAVIADLRRATAAFEAEQAAAVGAAEQTKVEFAGLLAELTDYNPRDVYRTYLNLLFVGGDRSHLLLVPSFADVGAVESTAFSLLAATYGLAHGPTEVVPVESDYLVHLQGSVHCLTKTLPEGVEVMTDEWGMERPAALATAH